MEYDLIIIGAGPGGYEAAIRASQLGMRVALAEKEDVGGTCLNRGCIPAKTFLHDAAQGHPLQTIVARKRDVVSTLRGGVETLLKKNNVNLLRGTACITGVREVSINGVKITANNILAATGSVPFKPPIKGIDLPGVMTSDDLLDLDALPENIFLPSKKLIEKFKSGKFYMVVRA